MFPLASKSPYHPLYLKCASPRPINFLPLQQDRTALQALQGRHPCAPCKLVPASEWEYRRKAPQQRGAGACFRLSARSYQVFFLFCIDTAPCPCYNRHDAYEYQTDVDDGALLMRGGICSRAAGCCGKNTPGCGAGECGAGAGAADGGGIAECQG